MHKWGRQEFKETLNQPVQLLYRDRSLMTTVFVEFRVHCVTESHVFMSHANKITFFFFFFLFLTINQYCSLCGDCVLYHVHHK